MCFEGTPRLLLTFVLQNLNSGYDSTLLRRDEAVFWRLSRQSYYSVASSRRDKWRNWSSMAASAL